MKALLITLFISYTNASIAQKHNAIFLEGAGSSLTGTLNYDFRFKDSIRDFKNYGLRLGIGASPKYTFNPAVNLHPVSSNGTALLILVGINTYADMEYSQEVGHDLEFGINFLYAQKNSIADKIGKFKAKDRIIPSINIGYRSQAIENGGFMWRIDYTPYFLDKKIHQWGGISIGYNFD